jgi:tetratricopeptide (TPR) repeat protein
MTRSFNFPRGFCLALILAIPASRLVAQEGAPKDLESAQRSTQATQEAAASAQQAVEAADQAATEPAVDESAASGAAGGAKSGVLSRGLSGFIQSFTGGKKEKEGEAGKGQDSALSPLEKGSHEELQKKVNELIRSAHMSAEKGRIAEAVKNVNDLIALKPYDAEYHLALALCYRREGKYAEALKKYQDVLDLGGPKALIAVLRAEASAADGKTDKVFEYLKEAAVGGRNIINDVKMLPILTSYQSDTEFIKLALQLEKVLVAPNRSYDPFTNQFPTNRESKQSTQEVQEAPVAMTPEEQEQFLQEAKKTIERVQFFIKLEDESKAMGAYTSLRDMIKKKELLTVPRIVNDFRTLVSRLESLEVEIEGIRLKYYYNQAQTKLRQMKDLFAEGEYKRVEGIHSEIVKLTQEMEQTNTRYKPVADQIFAASNRWVTRATIRQEFEARKPNIQGIVISNGGKMALLNDRVIKQGELMDDIRIVKVENNRVTFRYKGEEIPLAFRRY